MGSVAGAWVGRGGAGEREGETGWWVGARLAGGCVVEG